MLKGDAISLHLKDMIRTWQIKLLTEVKRESSRKEVPQEYSSEYYLLERQSCSSVRVNFRTRFSLRKEELYKKVV